MKILHIIAGLPREGGMSELVPLLALEQHRLGHDVTVVTVGHAEAATALQAGAAGVRVISCRPSRPHFLYYSFELHCKLGTWVKNVDLVHVHGCWTFPVWWGCHAALKHHIPYVRSPHGCLEPLRLRLARWKKRLAGLFFDRRYFEQSAVIHATAESEAQGIREYLFFGGRIVVIQNGVDIEAFSGQADREWLDHRWPECCGKRVALFLSRLHPIKGLDMLVAAWGGANSARVLTCERSKVGETGNRELDNQDTGEADLQTFRPSPWHLLIVGPDEQDTLKSLREQVIRLGLQNHVTFSGPLYGREKATAMASADLFVLPTRNENFGIVVAESLACGVPVITTKGAPWVELLGVPEDGVLSGEVRNEAMSAVSRQPSALSSNGRCGWWVDIGIEPLVAALREAMSLPDEERRAMGANGRRLVKSKYRWETVAERMIEVYQSLPAKLSK